MQIRNLVSVALIFMLSLPLHAQLTKLTIETVMQGPRYSGYTPASLRWSGDSQKLYFNWKRHTDAIAAPMDTYTVNRDGSNLVKLTEAEARLAPPGDCTYDESRTKCLYALSGDLWLYDFSTDKTRRLTATRDIEAQPRFLPGAKEISYQRGNNLYLHSLTGGSIEQLTDIRTGKPSPDEEEPKKDPKKELSSQDFLKQEEKDLLAIVKQRNALKDEARARRLRENPRKPYYLPARNSAVNLRLSSDRAYVIAILNETPEGIKPAIVPNYITESAYTEDLDARTKVGDAQGRARLVVIGTATGEVKNVELPLGEKPKATRVFNLVQSDDATKTIFLLRSVDNKDLWRMALDPATAKARILTHDHDDAWIGGPGIFRIGFIGNSIYYQSESTGYSHLYLQPFAGGDSKALSSGNYEVTSVELSRDKKFFYLTSSEGSPNDRHFYSLHPATGGPRAPADLQRAGESAGHRGAAAGLPAGTRAGHRRWLARRHWRGGRHPRGGERRPAHGAAPYRQARAGPLVSRRHARGASDRRRGRVPDGRRSLARSQVPARSDCGLQPRRHRDRLALSAGRQRRELAAAPLDPQHLRQLVRAHGDRHEGARLHRRVPVLAARRDCPDAARSHHLRRLFVPGGDAVPRTRRRLHRHRSAHHLRGTAGRRVEDLGRRDPRVVLDAVAARAPAALWGPAGRHGGVEAE